MITQEGVRASEYDLYQDADLVRQILAKGNVADRTVSLDVVGDDKSKRHQDIVVPKAGA